NTTPNPNASDARFRSNTVTEQSGETLRIRIEKYRPPGPPPTTAIRIATSHADVDQVLVLERQPVDDVVHQRQRGSDVGCRVRRELLVAQGLQFFVHRE